MVQCVGYICIVNIKAYYSDQKAYPVSLTPILTSAKEDM